MRGRLQLRLHEHRVVAVADDPLPVENNPRVVFERLFGEGGTPEERLDRMKRSEACWTASTRTRPPAADARARRPPRIRVSRCGARSRAAHPDGRRAEQQSTLPVPDRPIGIREVRRHVKLLYDLQWLAYQADLTRVFTLMYGRELNSRRYPEIGISEPHHGFSHHGDNPEQIEKFAKLNTYQVELFGYFLEKLRSTPDGDGNLLDHTILLYGGA